jgi:hypothetical protein
MSNRKQPPLYGVSSGPGQRRPRVHVRVCDSTGLAADAYTRSPHASVAGGSMLHAAACTSSPPTPTHPPTHTPAPVIRARHRNTLSSSTRTKMLLLGVTSIRRSMPACTQARSVRGCACAAHMQARAPHAHGAKRAAPQRTRHLARHALHALLEAHGVARRLVLVLVERSDGRRVQLQWAGAWRRVVCSGPGRSRVHAMCKGRRWQRVCYPHPAASTLTTSGLSAAT